MIFQCRQSDVDYAKEILCVKEEKLWIINQDLAREFIKSDRACDKHF